MALLDETDAEIYVSSNMAGAVLSVTVTIDGEEYTDLTAAVAGEDKSAEIELVDDYGLQSDGTGIIGDKLTVTYGADFGTPTNVSWYKNGKVVATNSVGDIVNDGLTRTISASQWGVGTYKVTITNTDGDMATTNEIVITDKEEAAKITAFTIEDDYTDGTDVDYATTDQRAVATVTLNKNYSGRFRIYKSTDGKYAIPLNNDDLATSVNEPEATAAQAITAMWPVLGGGPTCIPDRSSVLVSNAPTNYQVLNVALAAGLGSGYGFINDDGTVTYKWVLDDMGVTRGTEYVVTFDQDSISSDTPGTGTANVSNKATAPYVTTPAKLAVTKVSNGTKPNITFQDAAGNALQWFGYKADANIGTGTPDPNQLAGAGVTSTLDDVGFETAKIYRSTVKTTDVKNSNVAENESSVAGEILKGVWTGTIDATDTAFWFAKVELEKGIFGAEKVELISEVADVAQDAATAMTLKEDSNTATTAVVNFTNLRTNGKLYILQGTGLGGAGTAVNSTLNHSTAASNTYADLQSIRDAYNEFDAAVATTYVKSVDVAKGAEKVEVTNAISAPKADDVSTTEDESHMNIYMAVFIPEDEVNYGMIRSEIPTTQIGTAINLEGVAWAKNSAGPTGAAATANKADGEAVVNYGLFVEPELKSYTLKAGVSKDITESKTATTHLTSLDQFGNKIDLTDNTGDVLNAGLAMTRATSAPAAATGLTSMQMVLNPTGTAGDGDVEVSLEQKAGDTSVTKDIWYVTLTTKQYLIATCKSGAASGTLAGNNGTAVWTLSIATTAP